MKYYRSILLSFLFITLSTLYGYSQSKIKYIADKYEWIYINKSSGEEVSRILEGKEVNIQYDTDFKSWSISYINKEGQMGFLDLEFIQKLSDGTIKVRDKIYNESCMSSTIFELFRPRKIRDIVLI